MAAKKGETPEPILTYGSKVSPNVIRSRLGDKAQFFYNQWAFARRCPIDTGCPPRTDLFRKIIEILNPTWFEWHEWTERLIDGLCNYQWIGVPGCSGSAKTRNVAGFACAWWMCDPMNSSVMFCSTTAKALRKRGWAEVQKFYTTIPGVVAGPTRFGNFVDSRMIWQYKKGDDKHAIMGIAVEEGTTTKVADNIKGVHTRRQMIVIDEATAVPPAIFEACTNLYGPPEEFILVMMGNPRSRLDAFGRFCEPAKGWQSVGVDDEEWETVPQINGSNGICIRFDAEKSPNIVNPLPGGKLISKYLPTRERVEARRKRVGSDNDPSYWSNDRGFWAPDGLNKCLFSEVSIVAYDGYGRHKFTGENFQIIGAFDPARTGDRPTLKFAALGEIEGGMMGLEWMPSIVVPINSKSSNPIAFQLMERVRRECENVMYRGQKMQCPPENLGMDVGGGGADLCDLWQRQWSPKIMRIDFNSSPSESPCSHEDVRPENVVYRNLRAAMYHRTRNILHSKQLKGIDKETAQELCNLEFEDSRTLIVMVAKEEYRMKFKSSPDNADCGVILSEVARRKGMRVAALGETLVKGRDWEQEVAKTQEVFLSVEYAPEEQPEEEPGDNIWA